MKITEYGTIRSTGDIKRRKLGSASGASFADMLDAASADSVEPATTLSDIAATTTVENMLALQEITEEEVARKKLIQQGKNIIDELEKLRQQLLIGAVPYATLKNLDRQLSIQRQSVSDPRLLAILSEIELRAAVELAKLEKARENSGIA